MAKIKLRLPFAEISGTLGDYVFKRGKKDGEVIVAKRPKKKKPSKAQKAHWDRFSEAADYATAALADPELCAYYEARRANKTCSRATWQCPIISMGRICCRNRKDPQVSANRTSGL